MEKILDELREMSSIEKQLHVEFSMHVEDMQDPEVRGYMASEVRKMNTTGYFGTKNRKSKLLNF